MIEQARIKLNESEYVYNIENRDGRYVVYCVSLYLI